MALTQTINVKAVPNAKEIARQKAKLKKQLEREARDFSQIIISTWSRLGFAHIKADMADARGKLRRVEFETIKIDVEAPEIIWFKIKINHRTLFGWRSALPFLVRSKQLKDEDTIYELEKATDHEITVVDTPDNGVWLALNRLAGAGGIPKNVPFRVTLAGYPGDMSRGTLFLGYGERRTPHFVDLDDNPHLLIAGATRSGKSNMANNLICSLLLFTDPDELKFIFVDLKRVEFNFYKKAPHNYSAVISEAQAAIDVLHELLAEMDRRTRLMADRECKNLGTWNRQFPNERMPRIVLVIDEFAALRYHNNKKGIAEPASVLVTNITNLGRAVGIHLWVCTQYPVKEVIGNSVRVNMPLIISGRVENWVQSNVILGNDAAAYLPKIPGRMVYKSGLDQFEIQTPFVEDDDVRWTVGIARGKYEGLLSLDNDAPQVIYEHLAKYIGDRGGALSDHTGQALKALGIPFEAYKSFRVRLVKQGAVTVDGTTYRVKKERNTYRILPDALPETVSEAQHVNQEWGPSRWILVANVPSTIAEQQAASAGAQQVNTAEDRYNPTADFAKECLIKREHTRTPAASIWAAYLAYCKNMDVKPLTRTAFGMALGELVDKERKGGAIFYTGVELSPLWELTAKTSAV